MKGIIVVLLFMASSGNALFVKAQSWNVPKAGSAQTLSNIPSLGPARAQAAQNSLIQRQNKAVIETNNQGAAQLREVQQDISEIQTSQQSQAAFAAMNKNQYELAYQSLLAMLQREHSYDLRQAIFIVENTFLANQANYAEFSASIASLAKLCLELAGDTSHPNAAARFLALHRLMNDTVKVANGVKHLPPKYDFEDFWGRDNFTKQFVIKLLDTNSGQCRSLPLLYKLLADELGIKAYLSMAPNHLYVQVKDNKGELYSYETTNGHFVSDAYYLGSGYIKAGALKNRSYLDTLTQRETIALCLFDLAQGYTYRYGYDAFTEKCVFGGLRYYPHSVQGRMLAHDVSFTRFVAAWKLAGRPPQSQVTQHPALVPLFEEVQRRTRAVEEVGHEDMPVAQYAEWLKQVDAEKNKAVGQQAAQRFSQSAH